MKSTTFLTICSLLISIFSFGQTSTETFETESNGSTSFTDNGVIFNVISHVSVFDIQSISREQDGPEQQRTTDILIIPTTRPLHHHSVSKQLLTYLK